MMRMLIAISFFSTICVGHCCGGTIVIQRTTQQIRFVGSVPGNQIAPEPFLTSFTRGAASAALHLGDYSELDVDLVKTFTPANTAPGQWDAYFNLRYSPGIAGMGQSNHLWLGLDLSLPLPFSDRFPTLPDAGLPPALRRHPYQIDVTLDAYNRWQESGNTYRFAEFSVTTYVLIPEPSALAFVAVAAVGYLLRRSRP